MYVYFNDKESSFINNFNNFFISQYHDSYKLPNIRCISEGWFNLIANFRVNRMSLLTVVSIRKLECFCYLTMKTA